MGERLSQHGLQEELPDGSWASSVARRHVMQGNRSRDTRPELLVRSAVHAMGLRYRVAERPLRDVRRTADMVFRRARVAVFCDGCFWHGCPDHYKPPRRNSDYWHPKIERNIQRDRETDGLLLAAGWIPLRFWEHEDPLNVAQRIVEIVRPLLTEHRSAIAPQEAPAKAHAGAPGH